MSNRLSPEAEVPDVLQAPLTDIYLREIRRMVKEYQLLLNNISDLTEQEISSVINDLDNRWAYYNQVVRVSGQVYAVPADQEPDEPDNETQVLVLDAPKNLIKSYVNDQEYVSEGFVVVDVPVIVEGTKVAEEKQIHFAYRQVIISELGNGEDITTVNGLSANVDEVHVNYPFSSLEHTTAMLSYFFTEELEEIDGRALNAKDEIEAMLALGDFVFEPSKTKLADEFLPASMYLNAIIKLDTMPYVVVVRDEAILHHVSGKELECIKSIGKNKALAYLHALTFVPVAEVVPNTGGQGIQIDESRLKIAVIATLGDEIFGVDTPNILIPLSAIKKMKRVRTMIYGKSIESS